MNNKSCSHYFLISLIIAQWTNRYYFQNQNWEYFLKPSVMFFMTYFLHIWTYVKSTYIGNIMFGFIFSLLGDVFLMFDNMFLLGLISFAFAHIFYILAFINQAFGNEDKIKKEKEYKEHKVIKMSLYNKIFTLLISLGLYFSGYLFFNYLSNHLPDTMYFPVMIYCILIVTMIVSSIYRYTKTTNLSYYLTLAGGIIFACSDSLLSLTLFVDFKSKEASLMVMVTYYVAQYLIFLGTLEQYNYNISKISVS